MRLKVVKLEYMYRDQLYVLGNILQQY